MLRKLTKGFMEPIFTRERGNWEGLPLIKAIRALRQIGDGLRKLELKAVG